MKSSAYDTYIPPHPFSLFLIIYFDRPITQTFFDFPWKFKLSGVYCAKVLYDLGVRTKQAPIMINSETYITQITLYKQDHYDSDYTLYIWGTSETIVHFILLQPYNICMVHQLIIS